MSFAEIVHWSAGGSHIQLRRHVVQKIYVCNDKADDLLMTGSLVLRSVDGKEAESPYCARCVVDDANSTTPMIKYWQGWLVGNHNISYGAVLTSIVGQHAVPPGWDISRLR